MEAMTPELIAAAVALVVLVLSGVGLVSKARSQQRMREIMADEDHPVSPGPSAPGAGKPAATRPPADRPTLASRFFSGLSRSREALGRSLGLALTQEGPLAERLTHLEEALIATDCGVGTAMEMVEAIRGKASPDASPEELRGLLREQLLAGLGPRESLAPVPEQTPLVILVVGVNGSGKTTTIGKLARRYVSEGHSVLLAAGDTFRAGAIEQLKVWGERAEVPVIAHQEGADPAAVIYDAIAAGQARGVDVVICDTAGRLQAQTTLMDELAKVLRVMKKARPDAPHEVLLVLDATIGQNALSQARIFKEVVGVTGVALTKLDGTARGGVVVAVRKELGLPVKLVGLGEGADDLRAFDPEAFVDALLGAASADDAA